MSVAQQQKPKTAPVPVEDREILCSGQLVTIRVPKTAAARSCPTPTGKVHYLQFFYNVKGGKVNLFVHDGGDCAGKEICAEVKVWRKTLADQRTFLYVDLHYSDEKPTHRLKIVPEASPEMLSGSQYFETSAPLKGYVILSPLATTNPAS